MRSGKKHRKEPSHERWLVSYADFITLLFAFFVVLYASSQMDRKKAMRVAVAIQGGFAELGMFSSGSASPALQVEAAAAPEKPKPSAAEVDRLINDLPVKRSLSQREIPVSLVKRQLEEALQDEIRKKQIEMRVVPDGLVVSLREVGFFKSGEARLLPGAEPVLAHISKMLADRGFDFRVEGHTDNMPIHNTPFRSNWELSTARATEVVSVLTAKYHFDPSKISVAGYAEYRPVASNATEEGRRQNRRIDLVILAGPAPGGR